MSRICILFLILFTSCNYRVVNMDDFNKNVENMVQVACERGYFEGQRDAINGDIRIKMSSDSIYIWTKSCWNNGDSPLYNPTYLDSKLND